MDRVFLILAGVFGAAGVSAGAFGAHALRERLDPELLRVWNTGAEYHLLHALALVGVAWAASRSPGLAASVAGWAMTVGIIVFSGSLYVLALSGARWLGAATPLGGLAFIVGWLALAVSAWRG
ncbi:MAG: DUF423 domain-containing protein [Myxococcota bacterium]